MLFFLHLFTGIVIGLLLTKLLDDNRWCIPVIVGAVIPDLLDKPLGYFFFADIFGSGRIFMHGLFVACAFLILGLICWKVWSHPKMLAFAFGILSL